MKGSHFLVSYDDMEEDEIVEEDDMEDILQNRLEWGFGNPWVDVSLYTV